MGWASEGIERLDARLAALARDEGARRLRLGQLLEVLSRGGCFELGFSSLSAYALERCDRSVRWVEGARCLARRVEGLPVLRRAMADGEVSWSMVELLARVARPEDEARWVEAAESRTVRQMRVLVAQAVAAREAVEGAAEEDHAAKAVVAAVLEGGSSGCGGHEVSDAGWEGGGACAGSEGGSYGEAPCTRAVRVAQEEAWLFQATRLLLEHMGVRGAEAQAEALLAEGLGTLLAALPAGALDAGSVEGVGAAQQRWLEELARWRVEAEACCEGRFCGLLWGRREGAGGREEAGASAGVAAAAALGLASLEGIPCSLLDGHVRDLSRGLARRELEVSMLVLQFHQADGWRRLGYASESQYARERLGWSSSALRARRALALRLRELPSVGAALGAGELGVEAAMQVIRIATGRTQAAWVERARRRTIKHLREEVAAALTAVRVSGERDCAPPLDAEMEAFQQLEQAVVSGRVCGRGPVSPVASAAQEAPAQQARERPAMTAGGALPGEPISQARRVWWVMLGSLARWLEGGLQVSAGAGSPGAGSPGAGSPGRSSAGRVTLRLRMSRVTYAVWRALEKQVRPWLPPGVSWLRFLCVSMWQAWRHLLGSSVAYSEIYVRDRYRCLSPVCSRRDVTPHHLRFRSAGGGDEPGNVASICTWCHLLGIHGGRIRAAGAAGHIRWELGASGAPCLVVHGRERLAA